MRSIRLHILKYCQFKSYNSVNTRKAIFTHLNVLDVLYSEMKARTRFRIQRISRCRKWTKQISVFNCEKVQFYSILLQRNTDTANWIWQLDFPFIRYACRCISELSKFNSLIRKSFWLNDTSQILQDCNAHIWYFWRYPLFIQI